MSRQVSLREYQRSLSARLANLGTIKPASALGLQIGTGRWLIDLADAAEVIPPPPVVAVPMAKNWLAGVSNIRGNLYSIIDFPAFLAGTPAVRGPRMRLVLLNSRYRMNCGLLVDGVLGLRRSEDLNSSENDIRSNWSSGNYIDGEGITWKKLNVPQLIAHPDFLNAGLYAGNSNSQTGDRRGSI
jgi:twitching motility protein PilI